MTEHTGDRQERLEALRRQITLVNVTGIQFGPQGVRSSAICPGPAETPMLVAMALHLESDESRWTSGASLVVDGGIGVNRF